MTFGLVHASYSLPEWQAVKLAFFAPCYISCNLQIVAGFYPQILILTFIISCLPTSDVTISIGYKRNCVKQTALIVQTILFFSLSLIYHFSFSYFGIE